MTKGEFKRFLTDWKKLNDIAKDVIASKYKLQEESDYLGTVVHDGKIFFLVSTLEDGLIELDITQEVLKRLLPDEIVF